MSTWLYLRKNTWLGFGVMGEEKVPLSSLPKGIQVAVTGDLCDWSCKGRLNSPARLSKQGDTMCYSLNAKDCITSHPTACNKMKQNPPPHLKPLVCGEMHMKKWGVTGYEEVGHWCRTTRNIMLSGKPARLVDMTVPSHPKILAWGVMDGPVFKIKRMSRAMKQ